MYCTQAILTPITPCVLSPPPKLSPQFSFSSSFSLFVIYFIPFTSFCLYFPFLFLFLSPSFLIPWSPFPMLASFIVYALVHLFPIFNDWPKLPPYFIFCPWFPLPLPPPFSFHHFPSLFPPIPCICFSLSSCQPSLQNYQITIITDHGHWSPPQYH